MAEHDSSAPGELELVRRFINTGDLMAPADPQADAETVRAWLREHALLAAGDEADDEAAGRAVAVREALRDLTDENAGEPPNPAAHATLRAAAERAPLRIAFAEPGAEARLVPLAGGIDGALARLLAIVHDAMHDGTWRRLKACRDRTCRFAHYDHSKNRSAAWCDMAVCGNRAKARRRRAR